jgi:hypothetical protein
LGADSQPVSSRHYGRQKVLDDSPDMSINLDVWTPSLPPMPSVPSPRRPA